MQWRFRKGRRLPKSKWPEPVPVYTYDELPQVEDMPAVLTGMYLVSDRLKECLEREAPGDVQYFPVRLEGPRADKIRTQFWAMNFLRLVDCLDPKAPRNVNRKGDQYCPIPVIDPRLVPTEVKVGVILKDRSSPFVRGSVRRAILKGGFVGPQFSRIAVGRDPYLDHADRA